MKARSLVLILCIGLMCLTGFGHTTSDPTENSKAELVQMDDSVSVVITLEAEALEQAVVFSEDLILENRFDANFAEADKASEAHTNQKLGELLQNYITLLPDYSTRDRDVGWQSSLTTYEKTLHPPNNSLHFSARNARDGIRYQDFFLSS